MYTWEARCRLLSTKRSRVKTREDHPRAVCSLFLPYHFHETNNYAFPVSVLLHLLHPYAAGNLHVALQHIKRLHDDLKSLSPKSENAQMAKDVFMDGLESSGIYLDALEPLLKEIHRESQKTAGMGSCLPLRDVI